MPSTTPFDVLWPTSAGWPDMPLTSGWAHTPDDTTIRDLPRIGPPLIYTQGLNSFDKFTVRFLFASTTLKEEFLTFWYVTTVQGKLKHSGKHPGTGGADFTQQIISTPAIRNIGGDVFTAAFGVVVFP